MSQWRIFAMAWVAIDFVFVCLALKEILNLKDLKDTFTCEHCKTFNAEISGNSNCTKCNRKMQKKVKTWEHYLIFRVNKLDTKTDTKTVYKYKDYLKLSRIELVICLVAIFVLTTSAILNILVLLGK